MGATYTRQSSSAIVDGGIIEAADINAEFNQILAAFAVSSGHTHDGTAAEGGPITKLLGTAITIGDATSGTDIAVTFDGESADGVLTWMEDEDYFQFSDDLLLTTTEKLQFRDTAIYINSSADGQLDLVADTEIQIAATTVDINGAVALNGAITGATNITLSGELDAATLDISGNADIDGTLEADAITINGTAIGSIYSAVAGSSSIVTTGALDSGSITSGFGTIDTGASTITTTGLITGGSLDIDNVLINGTTIGHTDDTDLMTLSSGVLTVAGEVDAVSLDISGDADIDGTLEADAITINGTTLAETIADTVGAMVSSNTESNITVTQSFTNPSWYKPIRRGSGVNNSTNFQTGSFTELITQQRYPNAGSYLDTDNVWNGNFAYLYNKIQSSGSSDSTLFNPLKINQVVQGGNNVSLGISTFRPNLLGEIVNLQNPWAFLTQSIGPMNAEGIEKGYGLLELGGTIGTIQGIGEWDFYLPPGGATNYSSSLVNLCGKHLQVLNTLNTAIKNGDVIPNNDSASYTFEPPYAIGLGGIFLNTSPLAASSTNLQDNITGSGKSPFVLPVLSEEERADDKNYFQYNYIDSFVGEYKNFSKPFIIERGDEIRVTYTVPQDILFEDGATTQTFEHRLSCCRRRRLDPPAGAMRRAPAKSEPIPKLD